MPGIFIGTITATWPMKRSTRGGAWPVRTLYAIDPRRAKSLSILAPLVAEADGGINSSTRGVVEGRKYHGSIMSPNRKSQGEDFGSERPDIKAPSGGGLAMMSGGCGAAPCGGARAIHGFLGVRVRCRFLFSEGTGYRGEDGQSPDSTLRCLMSFSWHFPVVGVFSQPSVQLTADSSQATACILFKCLQSSQGVDAAAAGKM